MTEIDTFFRFLCVQDFHASTPTVYISTALRSVIFCVLSFSVARFRGLFVEVHCRSFFIFFHHHRFSFFAFFFSFFFDLLFLCNVFVLFTLCLAWLVPLFECHLSAVDKIGLASERLCLLGGNWRFSKVS